MAETMKEVQACRKGQIMINTFMLADEYYLVEFVKKMSELTKGKAYFANPRNLSEFVLMDFLKRRNKFCEVRFVAKHECVFLYK